MAKKKFSLEKHLQRLREIVDKMQSGDPDFDENVALFKEGSKLIKEAKDYLDDSELLIQKLIEENEEVEEEDFDIE